MSTEKIKELQRQIEAEQYKIRTCNHTFGGVKYDPETVRKGYGMRTVRQGSDMWSEYAGYEDVQVDRWSRTCTKCGFVQYTKEQEPVIKEYKPKFS